MCRLILVRHGETEWNRQMLFQGATDTDLSAKGLRQAELVGRRLAAEPFTAVYNSDLKRAVLTATAIAVSRGLTVVTD
ncbi:MAG: histidine phosphatase family protein, partial [Negativicutes bacterium]|nr:histidine phosphatase family protein [Negativicutes bacterium]